MFEEAITALHEGNRLRARDLLTRLLKTGKDNPEYWIWMSACVDTPKERIYCLKEALQRDPQNVSARRGLVMLGQLPVDTSLVLPSRYQKRNWHPGSSMGANSEGIPAKKKTRWVPIALAGAALVAVLGYVLLAFILPSEQARRPQAVAAHRATSTDAFTDTPSPAVTPTQSAKGGITPLALLIKETYTPTPLYVNTPHPISDAFKVALRAYQRGEWETARRYLAQALTAEPSMADGFYYIGESYRFQKDYDLAYQSYNQAININPDFGAAYAGRAQARLGMNSSAVNEARADLETAVEKDPDFDQAYFDLAVLDLDQNDLDAARQILQQVEHRLPNSAQLYYLKGRIDLRANEPSSAVTNARQAVELDITLLPAYLLLGQAMQAAGDLKGSLDPLTTYTLYETKNAQAWLDLAQAQDASGKASDAFQSFNRALELNGQFIEAYLRRGQIYLDRNQSSSALEDFEKAIRLDPTSFEAALGKAQALTQLDFPGDAYIQLEKAQSLAETDAQKAELYYFRARSLEVLSENEAALRDWRSLLDLPPASVPAAYTGQAKDRIEALIKLTPSPTVTPTIIPTDTRQPTKTLVPTSTRQPTATSTSTSTSSPTPKPSNTPVSTKTPVSTVTRTPAH